MKRRCYLLMSLSFVSFGLSTSSAGTPPGEHEKQIDPKLKWEFKHDQPAIGQSLAISPDGKLVAFSDWSGAVLVHDLATGNRICALNGHRSRVVRVLFSPNSRLLVAVCQERTVTLWDVAKRKVITSFKDKETPRYTAAFSSDGKILATLVRGEEIRFFDIDNPLVESSVYRWTEGKLSSMTFSPDGKWIAFADRNLGKICILDLKTKKLHMELPFVPKCAPLAFSPDGKWLAAANDRGAFAMWNTKEFSCVMNWPAKKYFSLCECLAFSPDSKQIAVGAGPVRFIDRETGKITMWLSPRHRGMTEGVAFSPDGKTLASSGWESVRAWDFTNLKFVVPGPDHGVVPRPKGLPWRFEPSNKK